MATEAGGHKDDGKGGGGVITVVVSKELVTGNGIGNGIMLAGVTLEAAPVLNSFIPRIQISVSPVQLHSLTAI